MDGAGGAMPRIIFHSRERIFDVGLGRKWSQNWRCSVCQWLTSGVEDNLIGTTSVCVMSMGEKLHGTLA